MKLCHLSIAVALFSGYSVSSQLNTPPTFGKGILNIAGKDSTWSMNIAARMQFLARASWDREEDGGLVNPGSSFLVRRTRLKFGGFAFSPKLRYKLELGLSNSDMAGASEFTGNAPRYILDAVVIWNFYEQFELWVGQTKLPGNLERMISSGNLQLVDRSMLNSKFNIDRDQGIQLRHNVHLSPHFIIREKLAVSQGEGRNVTSGNLGGYQYTGRVEVLPFGSFEDDGEYSGGDLKRESDPKLMLAMSYDTNQNAVRDRSNQGKYMLNDLGFYETTINTFFVDTMFKYRGFSFMGEYADRHADGPIVTNSDGLETGDFVNVGTGLNLQAGYLLPKNWEIAARFTTIRLAEIIPGNFPENQYTLGFSKYLVGHNLKIQSDMGYLTVRNNTNELEFRLQFDIHF